MAQLSKVLKLVRWASSVPFPPVSLQKQVVCLRLRTVLMWSSHGESLHCFLVGVNKSYVIATSDLWLFIHASNLLPSLPTALPYNNNIVGKQYVNMIKFKIHTLPTVPSKIWSILGHRKAGRQAQKAVPDA